MNDLMILQVNKDTVLQLTLAQYTILSVRLCLRQMHIPFLDPCSFHRICSLFSFLLTIYYVGPDNEDKTHGFYVAI